MKTYCLVLIMFFSTALSASEFNEAFDMSAKGFTRPANRIVSYLNNSVRLDLEQQKKEFKFISESLLKVENEFSQNPVYWFVRGLYARNLASFYQQQGDHSLVDKMIDEKDKFFLLAMSLDKKNEPHLSASAYAAMKTGLPAEFKQQAIAAELALGGSGESESYYWYLHWSNINELNKAGRLQEATVALDKMKQELSESDHKSDFDVLVKKIDDELKIKKTENKKDRSEQKASRDHQAFTEENVGEAYYRYLAIIAAIMAVIIFIVVMVELKRRKMK